MKFSLRHTLHHLILATLPPDAPLRWARILGAMVTLTQNKGTVEFALRLIVPRMAAAQAYLESTRGQKNQPSDFESQSFLWRNYAVASCSAFGA